jgi:hypothetical protein
MSRLPDSEQRTTYEVSFVVVLFLSREVSLKYMLSLNKLSAHINSTIPLEFLFLVQSFVARLYSANLSRKTNARQPWENHSKGISLDKFL